MSAELPNGWVLTTLETIAHWGSGGTPSRSKPELYGGTIPWFKTGELGPKEVFNSEETITHEALKASSAKLFPQGSVVVAMYGATIGKVSILGREAATNQACAVGIPMAEATSSGYLYNYLRSQKEAFVAAGQGGAQPNISQTVIKAWPIPIAPVPEQKRIADKLDTVLTRVDAVNTRLARVAPILKRFRQSVLAAATSGRLTEDWRQSTSAGSEAPKNWARCALKQIGKVSTGLTPSKAQAGFYGGDVPFVKPGDLDKGVINSTDDTLTPMGSREARMVRAGAVFVSCIGNLGKVGLAGSPMAFNQQINAIEFHQDQVLDQFGYYSCMTLGEWLEENSSATTIAIVNKGRFEQAEINVPPLHEQQEIVRRIEILFTFADRLEARLQAAQIATERLTPALLAKAFRGELVPQDPNDEPASELLRRLQQKTPSTGTKRGRKSAA